MKMKKVKHVFLLLVDQEIQDKIREYALKEYLKQLMDMVYQELISS